jgi:hypothetical protein
LSSNELDEVKRGAMSACRDGDRPSKLGMLTVGVPLASESVRPLRRAKPR